MPRRGGRMTADRPATSGVRASRGTNPAHKRASDASD
jgi:hypothetical protein